MKAIREFVGQPLQWVQPKATKQQFELHSGDEVLVVMRWQRSWRTAATVETAEGSWLFKRQGFRQQVVIEPGVGNAAVPTLKRSWTGNATLSFPDGHSYLWRRQGFWGIRRVWVTADGVQLLSFKARQGFLKTGGEVEVLAFAADLPELALLVSLGWYLVIMEARDASATAASTAAIS